MAQQKSRPAVGRILDLYLATLEVNRCGVLEILEHIKIKRISPEDFRKNDYNEAVFTQLLPSNYVRQKEGKKFDLMHFFNHPEMYENAFYPYTKITDLLIAAAYWDPKAPVLFTKEEMKRKDFKISVISDITCDIEGSIPSTKRLLIQ